jgi:hypothetical protein
MTCVALAIALWQTRRQIGPMQSEISALRTELGFLNINDPSKICAIQHQTDDPLVCEWRVYLPPGRKYRVRLASGFLPDQQGPTVKAWSDSIEPLRNAGKPYSELPTLRDYWFDRIQEMSDIVDIGPSGLQGEITLTAQLKKEFDEWQLELRPGGSVPIRQTYGDWLSDGRSRTILSGDIPVQGLQEQKSFAPDERIVLMYLRRPVFTEGPGKIWSSTSPPGDADSVVLWIESDPAAVSESK